MSTTRPPSPAPIPRSAPQSSRLRRRLRRMFAPFWVVPAIWVVLAVGAGLGLPQVDKGPGSALPLLFDGGVESARSVLSTTAGAMISVTGLVFSITIVVLQLASSQFSPRVLSTFLEDRVTQHTLGVFAASFVYALTVLRSLGESGTEQRVPQLAVTLAFALVLTAVAMFLAFIHHITQSIAVSTVVHRVGDQTRDLLRRSEGRLEELPETPPALPSLPGQTVVVAPRTGYLDSVDIDYLCRRAAAHGVRVDVLHALGTFVPEASPLALISGTRADGNDAVDWEDLIASGTTLVRERSMEQDLSFGIRRLVDIAERALSPGINDPTTAVQVLDELHGLLRVMAQQHPVSGVHLDEDAEPRVVTTEWTLEQYLDLALDEIAHYGSDGIQIPNRVTQLIDDLAVVALPENLPTIRRKHDDLARRFS